MKILQKILFFLRCSKQMEVWCYPITLQYEVRYDMFDKNLSESLCNHIQQRLKPGCQVLVKPLQGKMLPGYIGVMSLFDEGILVCREYLKQPEADVCKRNILFETIGTLALPV